MPAVHPEHRALDAAFEHFVQRLEHEAVAADRDQHVGIVRRGPSVALAQHRFGGFGHFGGRGEQADPCCGKVAVGANDGLGRGLGGHRRSF